MSEQVLTITRYVCTSVAGLGFCSLRFTSLRIPFPLPRAFLHDLRRMCQAAPVFPVPKLPVPEQGSALSVPIRKTPDFCQAYSAFHVNWLGFCSLRFTSLRIPFPLLRAVFATFRYVCTSVAGLGFCSLRFTSLRIPIPLPRAILQHCRNTHNKLCFLFLFRLLTRACS